MRASTFDSCASLGSLMSFGVRGEVVELVEVELVLRGVLALLLAFLVDLMALLLLLLAPLAPPTKGAAGEAAAARSLGLLGDRLRLAGPSDDGGTAAAMVAVVSTASRAPTGTSTGSEAATWLGVFGVVAGLKLPSIPSVLFFYKKRRHKI